MAGEIVRMKNKGTGKNQYPLTVFDAVRNKDGQSISDLIPTFGGSEDVYVSVSGRDSFDGQIMTPVKTLQRAFELANYYDKAVNIHLDNDTYRIEHTITIPSNKKYTIKGKDTTKITGFKEYEFAEDSAGIVKCYIGDLKPQMINVNGEIKYPASNRLSTFQPTYTKSKVVENGKWIWEVQLNATDIANLATCYEEVWITLLYNWVSPKFKILSVDTATNTFKFGGWDSNDNTNGHEYHYTAKFIMENVNFDITTHNKTCFNEGRYYYRNGWLYYKLLSTESISDLIIEVAQTEHLFIIDGQCDFNNIKFSGTSYDFTKTEFGGETGYYGYQGGWPFTGGIQIAGTSKFNFCTFTDFENHCIKYLDTAKNSKVYYCDFYNTGSSAVCVGEYMWRKMNPYRATNISIYANVIHDIGLVNFECCAINLIYGNDCEIAFNEVYNCYYTGISIGGGWWQLEPKELNHERIMCHHNKVYNILYGRYAMNDGAGIYTRQASIGSKVYNNLIYDINGSNGGTLIFGIYLDNHTSGFEVYNNLTHNCKHGIRPHYANSPCEIYNNIFSLCNGGNAFRYNNTTGFIFRNNILYGTAMVGDCNGGVTSIADNLYYKTNGTLVASDVSIDSNPTINLNPNFSDAENMDYSVTDEVNIKKIGFVKWDYNEVGRL
ncbi:MAG: right-handed parallel beta-helix repeat-containing protein [Phocaeicola sp.]